MNPTIPVVIFPMFLGLVHPVDLTGWVCLDTRLGVSEVVNDAWFYTAGGERIGPVTFMELRVLAAEGALNPRLDLAWTTGMSDWVPVGQVEGLFEKKLSSTSSDPINDAQALPRNPQTLDKLSESELELKLLEARWPGVSRRIYLVSFVVMPLLLSTLMAVLAFFLLDLKEKKDMETLEIVSGVASLVWAAFLIYISMQRFKNVGMSQWWILGNLVPVLNLWLGYRSICCPAGYEFHRKIDGKGIFLAVLYWGGLLLSMVLLVFGVIQLLQGAEGTLDSRIERLLDQFIESQEDDANVAPPKAP